MEFSILSGHAEWCRLCGKLCGISRFTVRNECLLCAGFLRRGIRSAALATEQGSCGAV
ncbi:hypothetical protein [Rubritalea halochordaticola]|uniref:hypothetical protein n=1 Tax=Rubritalea halochordaticola TaxID=714537 RepID=UPI0031FD21BB